MAKGKDKVRSGTTSKVVFDAAHRLPTISHLQFLALDLLAGAEEPVAAQILRDGISQIASDYGGPKFYQLMKRLHDSGFVNSKAKTVDVVGSQVTRTFYSATALGVSARSDTLAFYLARV